MGFGEIIAIMPFSEGEEVNIKKAGIVGKIVRERAEGEKIYLVHIDDQYFWESDLESLADYRIEPTGEVIVFLSERSTKRASGTTHPKIGARLAFKTKHDTAEFVRLGEGEGFVFASKEFIEDS